jgi:hypothetical protein
LGSIWAAGGIVLAVLSTVGRLVYTPIKDDQVRLETAIAEVAEGLATAIKEGPQNYISRRESEALRQLSAEDRANTHAAIIALQAASVSRNEWSLRNETIDKELVDVRRELDQLSQDFDGTYSLRDAIADLKEGLQRIESRDGSK